MNHKNVTIIALVFLLSGCSTLLRGDNVGDLRRGTSSSLVDYLYPDGEQPQPVDPNLPVLSLPLDVGIAFVPSSYRSDLSGAEKTDLLDRVAASFRDRPFVDSIQIIPEQYLVNSRGRIGMQQLAAIFDVDVMALVSYDQLSISRERDSSILYWTVVGALVVKGNENEVHTMVDTAVFDVTSSKLLFRAPGTRANQRNSTLIDSGKDARALRLNGFENATDDMIVNLESALVEFKDAIKNGKRAEVEWKEGSGGGGTDIFVLLALVSLFAARRLVYSRQQFSRVGV